MRVPQSAGNPVCLRVPQSAGNPVCLREPQSAGVPVCLREPQSAGALVCLRAPQSVRRRHSQPQGTVTGSHQFTNQPLLQSTLPIRRRRDRAHTYQPEDAATAHTYLPEDAELGRIPTYQKSLSQSAFLPICRRCYKAHTPSLGVVTERHT